MTLRVRLVVGLSLLLVVGLVVFGFATYEVYGHSLRQRLDDQLRSSVPFVSRSIAGAANLGSDRGGPQGPPQPPQPVTLPPYAALIGPDGTVVYEQKANSSSQPKLPDPLPTTSKLFTVGSSGGSGSWRVYAGPGTMPRGYTLVVAVSTHEISTQLDRLVLIELAAGIGLLVVLSLGSWLVLRHGLRPLERMAGTAQAITGGDLSLRVDEQDRRGEVGELGHALNVMLDGIQSAFNEREASEQRLRQFLADASHELRTPLTSIQGFAELFRLGADDEHARNDHVDREVIMRRIEEESARMKTLVEDLLLLARLDQTRATERVPVDLAVLAADACSDAIAADPSRRLTLDAPDPVVIEGDRNHLRQAIANLVSNAVQHTPAGTPIEVSAHMQDGNAVLAVRDHGAGLDADALAHAFDRFWRADRARVGSGAGLGLSIVAAIAKEHGGRALAATHADGGAVFTLELPLTSVQSARHVVPGTVVETRVMLA